MWHRESDVRRVVERYRLRVLRSLRGNLGRAGARNGGTAAEEARAACRGAEKEYRKKCERRHIIPGNPLTLLERDPWGVYLPEWFPLTEFTNPGWNGYQRSGIPGGITQTYPLFNLILTFTFFPSTLASFTPLHYQIRHLLFKPARRLKKEYVHHNSAVKGQLIGSERNIMVGRAGYKNGNWEGFTKLIRNDYGVARWMDQGISSNAPGSGLRILLAPQLIEYNV